MSEPSEIMVEKMSYKLWRGLVKWARKKKSNAQKLYSSTISLCEVGLLCAGLLCSCCASLCRCFCRQMCAKHTDGEKSSLTFCTSAHQHIIIYISCILFFYNTPYSTIWSISSEHQKQQRTTCTQAHRDSLAHAYTNAQPFTKSAYNRFPCI